MSITGIFNPIMIWLLRSPLHMLASKSTLIVTFIGRNSGKLYTTPVNYVIDDEVIYISSLRGRTWWRSLRGGALVKVCLQGRNLVATGEVIEDHENVVKQLMHYLQKVPQYASYFKVSLDPEGNPNPEDVAQAAKDRVMIRLILNESPPVT